MRTSRIKTCFPSTKQRCVSHGLVNVDDRQKTKWRLMAKRSCEARLDGLCVKGFSFRSEKVVPLILS